MRFSRSYLNLEKSAILATGGLAPGAISRRSLFLDCASERASWIDLIPSWVPSSSINRTSRARISSFTRGSPGLAMHHLKSYNVFDHLQVHHSTKSDQIVSNETCGFFRNI